jgi:anti-sigma factor RsiW
MKLRLPFRRRELPWPMCRDLMERVTDYLEGAMTPDEVAKVEAHLADCDGCDAAVEQFRLTIIVEGALSEDDVDAVDPAVVDELLIAFRRRQSET